MLCIRKLQISVFHNFLELGSLLHSGSPRTLSTLPPALPRRCTLKIYKMTKTKQNVVCTHNNKDRDVGAKRFLNKNILRSLTNGHWWCVEIGLHRFDIRQSRSQNLLNLLLWIASVTTVAACHNVSSLANSSNSATMYRYAGTLIFHKVV